ncbi:protein FRA10AC1 homolog [Scaptodrosophila lebanonensis]|uniref:Protein FRA10AC1 homolog n=1 Tax=Drosophila lebanonensis TaxID=7225 RepID=A0A6J2T4B3_DROLE|nr:protein FRA10AC1 homolog [Scaptodrosophila lebanonensis]
MSKQQIFPINLGNLSAKERHSYVLNQYVLTKSATEARKHKRDIDVIRENHRFLWDEDEANETESSSWEQRLALKYYNKLFKEYCIADLTRYKENKIALRWRTEQEVINGVGQFQCGSRHCGVREDSGNGEKLRSWEVNFKYIEKGVPLNALVKLRLCAIHTEQLNYRTRKREYKRLRRREKEQRKAEKRRKKHKDEDDEDDDQEEQEEEEAEKEAEPEVPSDTMPSGSQNEALANAVETIDDDIWRKPLQVEEKPSREQEFAQYLDDLLF